MLDWRAEPSSDQQRTELVTVQAGGVGLIIQAGPGNMRGRASDRVVLPHRVPVESGDGAQPGVMVARARPRASRSRTKNSMSARRA